MIDTIVVGAIATNCYIIPCELDGRKSAVVVDPGGDAEAIIARLARRDLVPALVVLTHGHFDHVAALPRLLARLAQDGADAPAVAIHGADLQYLGAGSLQPHLRDFKMAGAAAYVTDQWEAMPEAARVLSDGDRIGPFRVLHTPGHTPGSICLYDEAEGLLFSGDTLFAGGIGRTDLVGGDGELMAKSLERLLALPDHTRVFPGHGGETRIARERW